MNYFQVHVEMTLRVRASESRDRFYIQNCIFDLHPKFEILVWLGWSTIDTIDSTFFSRTQKERKSILTIQIPFPRKW